MSVEECYHTVMSKGEAYFWIILFILFVLFAAFVPLVWCSYCNVEDKCTLFELIVRRMMW